MGSKKLSMQQSRVIRKEVKVVKAVKVAVKPVAKLVEKVERVAKEQQQVMYVQTERLYSMVQHARSMVFVTQCQEIAAVMVPFIHIICVPVKTVSQNASKMIVRPLIVVFIILMVVQNNFHHNVHLMEFVKWALSVALMVNPHQRICVSARTERLIA